VRGGCDIPEGWNQNANRADTEIDEETEAVEEMEHGNLTSAKEDR
jgi:hypothetical protein